MFRKKKRFNKESRIKRLKLLLGLFFIFTGVSILSFYLYTNFYLNSYKYINPIWQDNNSTQVKLDDGLQKNKISFEKILKNEDGSFTVNLRNGSTVIFSPKKDITKQITSLQLVLARLTIEGKKLKVLDFRYANPVASF